nr:hypothetical protein [Tanacetum cinerariifolium]
MNEQLEAEVLTRSSNSSKTSYAVTADLSEMELKKILIEKMEGNKSTHRSDEQRNLYKALVEAYESDKIILDTYGDIVTLKRRHSLVVFCCDLDPCVDLPIVLVAFSFGALVDSGSFPSLRLLDPRSDPAEGSSSRDLYLDLLIDLLLNDLLNILIKLLEKLFIFSLSFIAESVRLNLNSYLDCFIHPLIHVSLNDPENKRDGSRKLIIVGGVGACGTIDLVAMVEGVRVDRWIDLLPSIFLIRIFLSSIFDRSAVTAYDVFDELDGRLVNVVRLKVEEESEMSLELLRFTRQQLREYQQGLLFVANLSCSASVIATSESTVRLFDLEALAGCLPFVEVDSLDTSRCSSLHPYAQLDKRGLPTKGKQSIHSSCGTIPKESEPEITLDYRSLEPHYLSTVPKKSKKCQNLLFKWKVIKCLTRESLTYVHHLPEILQVDNTFLVVHLEPYGVMMNRGSCLEFLHVYLWNICYDQKRLVERSQS